MTAVKNIEWCVCTLSSAYLVKMNEIITAKSQENNYGNNMILLRFFFLYCYHTLFDILGYQLILVDHHCYNLGKRTL